MALLALSLCVPPTRASAARLDAGARAVSVDSATAAAVERAALESGLRPAILHLALRAYQRAALTRAITRSMLTVVDYTLPSHTRRLWVLDLAHGTVLAHEFVAHGRGSGDDGARHFSNRDDSFESSIGTFVTADTYQGSNGLSLRLQGLDRGVNDHALRRGIVMHGAWYVSEEMIQRLGRLGRSEGCLALSTAAAPRIIPLIAGGSVLYVSGPSGPPAGSGRPRSAGWRHGGRAAGIRDNR